MKDFATKEDLMKFLADSRIACSCEWDPSDTGNCVWYQYPDFDEDDEVFYCSGSTWRNPTPIGDPRAQMFPRALNFRDTRNILYFANISIDGEKTHPIAIFDAFDENGEPSSFAMFGNTDTSLSKPEDRIKLIDWVFDGVDEDDELAWTPIVLDEWNSRNTGTS